MAQTRTAFHGYKKRARRATAPSSLPHLVANILLETVVSYSVSTTHIISGLPPSHQKQVLSQYRTLFHDRSEPKPVLPGSFHTALHYHSDVNATYDLSCQYLSNLHAMQVRGTHTDSEGEDSLFSSDDEMPPLADATTSSAPSPTLGPTPALPTVAADNTASATNVDKQAEASAATKSDDGDPELPPVPPLHPWSTSEGWKKYWQSVQVSRGRQDANRRWSLFPKDSKSEVSHHDGEGVESAWADLSPRPASTRQVGEEFRHSSLESTGDIHRIKIMTTYGARHASCDCTDNLHSVYEERRAFAFEDMEGNLVIKKQNTRLLAVDGDTEGFEVEI
ncbi:hypothetical protein C8R47DRAFT_1216109 [Mycena vitilis]|nr:hypothetical protein C8R47DRAFT_1216109 [Mycena vitilis]